MAKKIKMGFLILNNWKQIEEIAVTQFELDSRLWYKHFYKQELKELKIYDICSYYLIDKLTGMIVCKSKTKKDLIFKWNEYCIYRYDTFVNSVKYLAIIQRANNLLKENHLDFLIQVEGETLTELDINLSRYREQQNKQEEN